MLWLGLNEVDINYWNVASASKHRILANKILTWTASNCHKSVEAIVFAANCLRGAETKFSITTNSSKANKQLTKRLSPHRLQKEENKWGQRQRQDQQPRQRDF